MPGLTHFDAQGRAIMVNVGNKEETCREAVARGSIWMNESAFAAVRAGEIKKGDVLGVARVAGLMALKQTGQLIPLCHPLMIEKAEIDFHMDETERRIEAICRVGLHGCTGVEMEALTGVSVALLTIYDMCKAVDKGMVLGEICLQEKTGGKSGPYRRGEQA